MNTPQKPKGKADILIVDDVPDNIRFLSSFLLEQGYSIRKAINGQMALTAVNALIPDLIILDVNMPDMTGYEICDRLKHDPLTDSIPVLFLSAGNEAIDKVKAFQKGAADYITKPFHLEEVLARIQTHLTIQSLQQELKEQNEQLKQALINLQTAQANLVQQEKMATLRKVVAGVAHEINNPLSFIACNIQPAQKYINSLTKLIELYEQQGLNADPVIQNFLNQEEIDLEFLLSDLSNILNSMASGSDRIRTIILALRIFTRLDESGIKQINIHESIDNILPLFQHRLSDRADEVNIHLTKDYGNLPLLTCYGDQFNQVIFNLLSNAIDAIDEKLIHLSDQLPTPEISIHTYHADANQVIIKIKDTGIGIADEIRSRVFEPFFTTKPAGKGIGLALATSKRIVEELHNGSLTFTSCPEGTEFVIQLPISGRG